MNLTQKLLPVALLGAEWVLWLLVCISVVSVAIMIERYWYFRSTGIDVDAEIDALKAALGKGDVDKAEKRLKALPGIEGQVVGTGLGEFSRGPSAVEKAMASSRARMRLQLERNLAFLGTVGNNAPFVGLFGTVIGVIRAFHDLAAKKGQGPEAVMGSLSEALIATAVGLLVALPAVVAFNYFNRRVRARISATDALSQLLLSRVKESSTTGAVAGAH